MRYNRYGAVLQGHVAKNLTCIIPYVRGVCGPKGIK